MIVYTPHTNCRVLLSNSKNFSAEGPKQGGRWSWAMTSPWFSISYSFHSLLTAERKLSMNNFIRSSNKPPEHNVSSPSRSPGNEEATYLAWPQDAVEMKFKSALCLQRPLQNPLCSQIPGRSPLRDYAVCLGAVVVCLFSLRLVFLFITSKLNFILMHWSIK